MADPAIKYGGGAENIKTALSDTSGVIALNELNETQLAAILLRASLLNRLPDDVKQTIAGAQERMNLTKEKIFEVLLDAIDKLKKLKGEKDALSD